MVVIDDGCIYRKLQGHIIITEQLISKMSNAVACRYFRYIRMYMYVDFDITRFRFYRYIFLYMHVDFDIIKFVSTSICVCTCMWTSISSNVVTLDICVCTCMWISILSNSFLHIYVHTHVYVRHIFFRLKFYPLERI